MRKIFLLVLVFQSFCVIKVNAQSCFNIFAGNDTTISCLQPCLDLKARVPDVKTTDDYQVIQIPYTPYPYTNPTGVVFDPAYVDDLYSDVINLPFTFCFYGLTYTNCVVGTNGILTFDAQTNKNTYNAYLIDRPIPYAGGSPNNGSVVYYPKASIMGPFHDIDPELLLQPYNRKMEYIVQGVAPCRKFIVNFYKIPYYGCADSINVTTQQMVLYEGTGIIDIFVETKPIPCGSASNTGHAILGLQNWAQDKQVSPPGRNYAVWSSFHEAWRFVPNGGSSLLNRVELYKNGALISTATTTPLGNGQLEALFANVCQPEDSMSYAVKAFYQKCDDPAIETEGSDTMIVYKTLNPVSVNSTDVKCFGTSTGTITVTSPLAANVEYSINGGASWQNSPAFTVPAGNYIVQARVIGSLCGGATNTVINEPTQLTASASTTVSTCANNDGTLTVTAGGATPAYEYSIDAGVTYVPTNIFTGLSVGSHTITIRDANGCTTTTSSVVGLNDTMRLELGPDSTICFGSSITLLPQTNDLTDTFKWTPSTRLNFDTVKNPVASPLDTIKYYLTAKWGVCQRKDSIIINVKHKPRPFAGNDTVICYKGLAFLNGSASNLSGTVNFAWSPTTNVLPPNFPIAIAKPDTTQMYILTVTDNYGCNFSVSDSVLVTMEAPVPAYAGNDTNAILGVPHQLLGSGGTGYVWSPSVNLNNPFAQNPLATLYNDTYFRLQVTDAIGCIAYDDVVIKVYAGPTYYVPNAFSPNGDGMNEIFRPIPVGISQTDYFMVFNRLGELVYQTNQWLKGWDGKFKGKDAASGVYVWMVKGKDKYGKVVEMKGTVTLVR